MMKKIFLLVAIAMMAMSLSAAPVDQTAAQQKARKFLSGQFYAGKIMAPAALNPVLLKAEMGSSKLGQPVFYIFNTSTTYVIVAGDDRAEEILMVGDEPIKDINNIPPGMQDMLNQYKTEIMYLQEHPGLKVDPIVSPENTPALRGSDSGGTYLLDCKWDQEAPYYNLCKFTRNGTTYQCLTGCPATSASMVMYYWKHPTTQVAAIPSYTGTLDISSYNSVSFTYPALEATTFDWDNMKDTYSSYNTAQGNAVATLMRYVGQAEKMMYGTAAAGGSGIYTTDTQNIVDMFVLFGYDESTCKVIRKSSYSETNWAAAIQAEMNAGRPIVFMAVSSSAGGHAFNVDGYNSSTNKYHVNFGWSGSYNGWMAMNSFSGQGYTFNSDQQAVIGIQPADLSPVLTVSPSSLTFTGYAGNTYTQTFTVTGKYLEGNVTLSCSGTGYSISPTTLTAAQAQAGATITVTYSPTATGTHSGTVTVASSGAESQKVTLSGTANERPVINPTETAMTFTTSVGTPVIKTFYVKGTNLAGSVTLSCEGTGFSINKTSVSKTAASTTNGSSVTVTYNPTTEGTHTGTITLTSEAAETKTITLNGTATDNTPVINVSPASLTFTGVTEQTYTQTFTVTGANLTGDLSLSLDDDEGVFDLNRWSITSTQAANGVTVTVTYEPEAAGTHNATVTISGGGAASKSVAITATATEPVRTITATPASLTFNTLVGESVTQTFTVTGENLKGSNLTLTLNDETGTYALDASSVTIAEATAGKTVTVTYAPSAFGTHNATVTISGGSANPVTVTLAGQANLTKYAPVMLEPNDLYVALTQFRADWTDATPEENVSSYTLEVSAMQTAPELIGTLNGSSYTGTYADITLTAPWGGAYTRCGNGAVYFRTNSSSTNYNPGNITFTIPEGYNNATFTVIITTATNSNGAGSLAVATPQTSAVSYTFASGATHTWVVTASAGEKITITTSDSNYSPDMTLIEVYAGDATAAMSLNASESGDAAYRLITGITPDTKFYIVTGLTAEGTFEYKVKALYIDGTESDWSNIEVVTLHENAHPYAKGDVNHSGKVDVADVQLVIERILGKGTTEICELCADVNGDGNIDVADVSGIIDIVLGKASSASLTAIKPLFMKR